MVGTEHRGPLLAFALVAAAAVTIMGNGLRSEAVRVLIRADAPSQVISALAPDMVLAQTFEARQDAVAAPAPEPRRQAPRAVPASSTLRQAVAATTAPEPRAVVQPAASTRATRSAPPAAPRRPAAGTQGTTSAPSTVKPGKADRATPAHVKPGKRQKVTSSSSRTAVAPAKAKPAKAAKAAKVHAAKAAKPGKGRGKGR